MLWVGYYPCPQSTTGMYAPLVSQYFIVKQLRLILRQKLEAIIMAQFSTGPGHEKVFAGEYELFDNATVLTRDNFGDTGLLPGMSITMAIIVGQYGELVRCPRPDCKSLAFATSPNGGKIW
jgi:hypothetical protein